jgi:NTP pyrophosphatase (non-canonical NTP hydrolase)
MALTFDEYAEQAKATAVYPTDRGLEYAVLGLCGEAGELANKVKKILRGDYKLSEEVRLDLTSEAGDVQWYLAAIARELNVGLGTIAEGNLTKLQQRKQKGVLKGSGDER